MWFQSSVTWRGVGSGLTTASPSDISKLPSTSVWAICLRSSIITHARPLPPTWMSGRYVHDLQYLSCICPLKGKLNVLFSFTPPSPSPSCPGRLGVPHPGGVSPRASGAAGERERWGDAGCEGQWRGSGSGDDHSSQAVTHQHAARVNNPPNTLPYFHEGGRGSQLPVVHPPTPLASSNQRFLFPPRLLFSGSFFCFVLHCVCQAPAAAPLFRSRVPLGEALAGRSAPERRCDGGDGRPAGCVTFPTPCTLHASQVVIASFFFSAHLPLLMFQVCVYIPLFGSVGHVYEFLCLPQLSSGGLPAFPSSALLLWLEEQPADR